MLVDRFHVSRLAVRSQSHEFVFAAVHLETAVVGERRVEQAHGMRELQLVSQLYAVAFSNSISGRTPLSNAIQSHDRSCFKRTRKERARRVTFVVIEINKRNITTPL